MLFTSLELLPLVNQVYKRQRTMTFFRDLYDDGCYSRFGYEDLYGFGGLNGYQYGSPYGYYRYGSPYGYRSFGSLYGNRGLISYGGFDGGFGDLYRFGYGYPFSSRFGSRCFY